MEATKDDITAPKEYVVSGFVCLVDTPQGGKYVVRWPVYGPKGLNTGTNTPFLRALHQKTLKFNDNQTLRHKVHLSYITTTRLLKCILTSGKAIRSVNCLHDKVLLGNAKNDTYSVLSRLAFQCGV